MATPSPAEPVTLLRKVPIRDIGEHLVDFMKMHPEIVLDRMRFRYRRETLLRASVAEKLWQASRSIEKGFKLAIIEGWRAPHIQRRMYLRVWAQFKELHPAWSDAQLKRVVNRYSAPLDTRVPPPHMTGGAMDVSLLHEDGTPCDMSSPFKWRDPKSFALSSPGLSETARRHREILSSAMIGAGITNYPSEYWHYSYGDQGWAYRGGHPAALYGAVTPEGWNPEPSDVSEEPLVFVEDEA